MKNDEMDLKKRSKENRKKRFKYKLLGGIGLCSKARDGKLSRID